MDAEGEVSRLTLVGIGDFLRRSLVIGIGNLGGAGFFTAFCGSQEPIAFFFCGFLSCERNHAVGFGFM